MFQVDSPLEKVMENNLYMNVLNGKIMKIICKNFLIENHRKSIAH